ncbi:hypothetical protein [Tunicatimonas pelagia]|uniref:hypothetical protein n=1 Tax=Tunicatimonas pelagia TaxID=931531 RepID=UPI0026659491|nr:hypothetical protein [Tunicatimonas pelagia]WKN40505.1 hypothetical protein P0M28_15790 [Tunicatimonas pelagia]
MNEEQVVMGKIVLIVILLLPSPQLIAQVQTKCDSVVNNEYLDSEPQYGEGQQDVMKFATKKLTPILSESIKQSGSIPTRMIAKLLINQDGKVVDVEFIDLNVKPKYKSRIKDEIQQMK